jgi:hypothetical protein
MRTHFRLAAILVSASVAISAAAAHAAAPTADSLMDAGYSRSEAQGLLSDLEAGGVRQAIARRIVSGDPAQYGNSAAGLAARSDLASADGPAARPLEPSGAPAVIEVVRPERTVVHDAALPSVLGGLALLLGSYGLLRTRSLERRIAAARSR